MEDRLQAGRSGLRMSLWPGTVTSLTNFTIQQSRSFEGVCIALRLMNCLFPVVPDSTYGDRAFPVAAVRSWNSLAQHIASAPSLPAFCCCLKTYFIELCYP